MFAQDAIATDVYPQENLAASRMRFEMDGLKLFKLMDEMENRGQSLAAIYHSHTRSEPYPSQTDVNFSINWPGVEWIIVGLSKTDDPVVRSYLIDDGEIREVDLVVT